MTDTPRTRIKNTNVAKGMRVFRGIFISGVSLLLDLAGSNLIQTLLKPPKVQLHHLFM